MNHAGLTLSFSHLGYRIQSVILAVLRNKDERKILGDETASTRFQTILLKLEEKKRNWTKGGLWQGQETCEREEESLCVCVCYSVR